MAPTGAEAKRTKVQPNDVLMSITADLGRACVVPGDIGEAYINQHLSILRLKQGLNPYYLSYYIVSDGGRLKLLQKNKGGVKAGLNFDDIKSFLVFLPPIDLQNKFASIVEQVEQTKQKMRASLDEMDNHFNALMQRYFG
jgi:type I restriction enzyme S subunit